MSPRVAAVAFRVHVVSFVGGVVCFLAAAGTDGLELFFVAGALLSLSGLASIVGARTVASVGMLLRKLLGRGRPELEQREDLQRLHARVLGVMWLVLGFFVAGLGLHL